MCSSNRRMSIAGYLLKNRSTCVNAPSHCRLTPRFQRTSQISSAKNLRCQKLKFLLNICVADSMSLSLLVCTHLSSKTIISKAQHTGVKQNLTQNGHSGSFKVTRFNVSKKPTTDYPYHYIIVLALSLNFPKI